MAKEQEKIAEWLAERDGYNWQYYTDNEKVENPKEFVLAFLKEHREEADQILDLMLDEPKSEYNSEVCQNSGLEPDTNRAVSLCKIGHVWSSDCIHGIDKKCLDFVPAKIPTLNELKEKFGKPKP